MQVKAQSLYFPPLTGSTWDTVSPQSLNWCIGYIDTLYNYLQAENTRAFIVLKDGKIVLEKYFGNHTRDSLWYWASAGKTLTAFLVGKAQEENKLKILDTTSKYLGIGWTSLTTQQEEKITIRHQLSMTTGLDDNVPDVDCTQDTCLQYLAEPGTRWAYHNAPYTLLEDVVSAATGTDYNVYTTQKLKSLTGMTGFWFRTGPYNNVYYSNARSMARFGLLMQNKGKWNTTVVLSDTQYLNQMINTSQNINLSYGYLWWLNGKPSFMLPGVQLTFPGSWAPNAPADMHAALGKNGQVINVSPSKGLVVVRMGDATNGSGGAVSIELSDEIWKRLNLIMCNTTSVNESKVMQSKIEVYPNPAEGMVYIKGSENSKIVISDISGRTIKAMMNTRNLSAFPIDISDLSAGTYFVSVQSDEFKTVGKLVVK
jgi:CubicO group peptidase (beta-lactamase class C family)